MGVGAQKIREIMERLAFVGPAVAENPAAVIGFMRNDVRESFVFVFAESQ